MIDYQDLAKKMQKHHFTLKQLGITRRDIREMQDLGYQVMKLRLGGDVFYYVPKGTENVSVLVSGHPRKDTEYSWLAFSDTHIGCKQHDEVGLRSVLEQAVDLGIEQAYFSGDMCDGYKVYPGQMLNLKYWRAEDQAEAATAILGDYNLQYYAIKGNHDAKYEHLGSPNPLSLIENDLDGKFTFVNTYCGDFVIGGVVNRLVHLGGGGAYAKSYPGQTYLRNVLSGAGDTIFIRGHRYKLKFLQLGHLHTKISFEDAGVEVLHPGNFQFPNDFTLRKGLVGPQGAYIVRTTISPQGRVLKYTADFLRPR